MNAVRMIREAIVLKTSKIDAIKDKILHYRPTRWTLVRVSAIFIGSFFVVSAIPIFAAGYSTDIVLQLPAAKDASATDFIPVSVEMESLPNRNAGASLIDNTTVTNDTAVSSAGTETLMNPAVDKNTFVIT